MGLDSGAALSRVRGHRRPARALPDGGVPARLDHARLESRIRWSRSTRTWPRRQCTRRESGAGYGTLDCFRLTGEFTDYNFLSGARRLDLNARVSKIGIGQPLDGAPGLCPQAKKDVFSNRLNYYIGATLRQPVFLGLARSFPTITLYTQRLSEYNAYRRTTAIGGIAVA